MRAVNSMNGQAQLKFRAERGAFKRAESFVIRFAEQNGLNSNDRARALILAEELISNLVKYGYQGRAKPGAAQLGLQVEGQRLTIELVDDGAAFDPFAAPAPDFNRPLEARPPGGLGLQIIRLLAEKTSYSRVEDRNVTRLTLNLDPPAAS